MNIINKQLMPWIYISAINNQEMQENNNKCKEITDAIAISAYTYPRPPTYSAYAPQGGSLLVSQLPHVSQECRNPYSQTYLRNSTGTTGIANGEQMDIRCLGIV